MKGKLAKCILALGLIGAVTLSGMWIPDSEVKATPTSETAIMAEGEETVTVDKVPTAKYAAEATESNLITANDIEIKFTTVPELGKMPKDVNYGVTSDRCKLGFYKVWYKGRAGMRSTDVFTKLATYKVEFIIEPLQGYQFDENNLPNSITLPNGEQKNIDALELYEGSLYITICFSDWAPNYTTDRLYFYPNATGSDIYINEQIPENKINTEEAMNFINGMSNITMSAVVKYGNTKPGNAYALFTLVGDNGKYFTIWHQPHMVNNLNTTRVFYAFNNGEDGEANKASKSNTFFSDKGVKINTNNHGYHKIHFSLTSLNENRNAYINFGMDTAKDLILEKSTVFHYTIDSTFVDGGHYDDSIFHSDSEYNAFLIGQKAPKGTYVLEDNGTTIPMLDLLSTGNNSNVDNTNVIKYVELSGELYDDSADFDKEINRRDPLVKVEFDSSLALQDGVLREDYDASCWNEFSESKIAYNSTHYADDTDWAVCEFIDNMKNATGKLRVCLHNYIDGVCNICGCQKGDETTFNVKVFVNGKEDSTLNKTGCKYGQICSVTAPEEIDGWYFSHWSWNSKSTPLGKENAVCYTPTYNFYVTCDQKLYAVYVKNKNYAWEDSAITMSNMYAKEVAGKNRVYFEATRSVPSEFTVLEHGILYTTSSEVSQDDKHFGVDIEKDGYPVLNEKLRKVKGDGIANNGVLTFTASVGEAVDNLVYVRGYVVYRDAEGTISVTYTAIASESFNSLLKNNITDTANQ